MRRLLVLLGTAFAVVLLSAPTAGMAATSATPTPTPTVSAPVATSPGATPGVGQPQPVVTSGDSTTAKDALTIVGFSIVAMGALILLIRAGMRSADAEDED